MSTAHRCALHGPWRTSPTRWRVSVSTSPSRERRGRLKDGPRRAHSNWDRPDGGRALWLTSCRDSECVNELAQLLLSLEATVRYEAHPGLQPWCPGCNPAPRLQPCVPKPATRVRSPASLCVQVRALQKGEDITERPPWRTESTAHEYMGVYARRFFEGFGASDGKIVGYLPPEGEDGALWHMVHGDDKDEEDLDEHEVVFAINNYREGLTRMGEEERVYLAQYHASQAAAAEEAEEEEEDDDEDEEAAAADDDAEEEEEAWSPEASGRRGGTRSGVQRGAETQPRLPPSKIELRAAGLRPRLWNSKECRERWMHALKTVGKQPRHAPGRRRAATLCSPACNPVRKSVPPHELRGRNRPTPSRCVRSRPSPLH